jgi:methylenetetrahydrofolate reductase (NADPH)
VRMTTPGSKRAVPTASSPGHLDVRLDRCYKGVPTMADEKTNLDKLIDSGESVLVADMTPPGGSDVEAVRSCASRYAGRVHALGVSDNRDGVRMSALAAASVIAAQGVEPILHLVTRDRNRIALASECLGAHALGVRNVLCTTGTHQTLGSCRGARNVFDIDSIQLLRMCSGLPSDGAILGAEALECVGSFCLGAVASPFADPLEMQLIRLAKKVSCGAKFLITQPVFDLERFETWWREVTRVGIHERVAILAGIRPLLDARSATVRAETAPSPMIPDAVLTRLASETGDSAQRAVGIEVACETIERLSSLEGLRGFEIGCDGDDDAALEVIEKSGLGCS